MSVIVGVGCLLLAGGWSLAQTPTKPKPRTTQAQEKTPPLVRVAPHTPLRVKPPVMLKPGGIPHLKPMEPKGSAAASVNDFAWAAYQVLRKSEKENLFFSPYSITSALAMMTEGARGKTAQELVGALRLFLFPNQRKVGIRALREEILSHQGPHTLTVVNRLWVRKGMPLQTSFARLLTSHYDAGIERLSFAKPELARQTINQWVAKKTQKQIQNLLGAKAVTPETSLVLTNAIAFAGKWAEQFDAKGTKPGAFYTLDGKKVLAEMMFRSAPTRFGFFQVKGHNCSMVELPYQGKKLSMLLLIPPRGKLAELESRLSVKQVDAWYKKLLPNPATLYLHLPKFQMTQKYRLRGLLGKLGVKQAFLPGKADFSGISAQKTAISNVVHKAHIKIDEAGTVAAAATGMTSMVVSLPPTLRVDRPFVFAIRDQVNGTILFLGRMARPM